MKIGIIVNFILGVLLTVKHSKMQGKQLWRSSFLKKLKTETDLFQNNLNFNTG